MTKRYLVTGGAGFIGSAVVRQLIQAKDAIVCVFDKLTYAGNIESLATVSDSARYSFCRGDIADQAAVRSVLSEFRPDVILNLAAESHVDRSIDGPDVFVQTNVVGTFVLLEETLRYWRALSPEAQSAFRFLHVSTDEVFGSLGAEGRFVEETPYSPRSPYSASKAASDHFVRAWTETYGLPTIVTNCSNNYGPYHFPEKLIPLTILNAMEGRKLPVYGKGENVRDWLFVEDHADALILVAERGTVGESYNVGGDSERTNIEVVRRVCELVDSMLPNDSIGKRSDLIEFVADRPGHDLRYAIDAGKIRRELGWRPKVSFEVGLEKTVHWYIDNPVWWQRVRSGLYKGDRLGLGLREEDG